jgi:hypothetical protein
MKECQAQPPSKSQLRPNLECRKAILARELKQIDAVLDFIPKDLTVDQEDALNDLIFHMIPTAGR